MCRSLYTHCTETESVDLYSHQYDQTQQRAQSANVYQEVRHSIEAQQSRTHPDWNARMAENALEILANASKRITHMRRRGSVHSPESRFFVMWDVAWTYEATVLFYVIVILFSEPSRKRFSMLSVCVNNKNCFEVVRFVERREVMCYSRLEWTKDSSDEPRICCTLVCVFIVCGIRERNKIYINTNSM